MEISQQNDSHVHHDCQKNWENLGLEARYKELFDEMLKDAQAKTE